MWCGCVHSPRSPPQFTAFLLLLPSPIPEIIHRRCRQIKKKKEKKMSGLEVVGIVASIVQIADLGARISVKLCSFYRTVKDANQYMQSLSSDVSLTCSVLNELGNTLKQDEKAKLYSPEAFKTAQEVLSECKSVFEGIDKAMEEEKQESAKNAFLRRARKLTVAFMGPNLDVLKSNLERLKSTMMLMLHVIMYAGQIRQLVYPRDKNYNPMLNGFQTKR